MKLLFISLGCDKNLVDSEEMLGMLAADGHEIVMMRTKQRSLLSIPAVLSVMPKKKV